MGMDDLFALATSEAESQRRAEAWVGSISRKAMVGSRHHIVPHFHLKRFADAKGKIQIRDRSTGVTTTRAIRDLAVTDFYTFVNVNGELDSSFETILNAVEGAAAEVIRSHLDLAAFARSRGLRDDERTRLDTYTAAQAVRGMRIRRQLELVTDYGVKLMNQGQLSADDVDELRFVPHQNEHIRLFGDLSDGVFLRLADRAATIVHLDKPLFLIGDEPVVLGQYDDASWAAPLRAPLAVGGGGSTDEYVHLSARTGGLGFEACEGVIFPLSPRSALVYGPRGSRMGVPPEVVRAAGVDALETAEEVNTLLLANAVEWVGAHPEHETFVEMAFPPATPMIHIADGGSVISGQANADDRRRPHRLWRDDPVTT
jgi:hypothetical protein